VIFARSFPRSAWECSAGRSASQKRTRSVRWGIPTRERGNDQTAVGVAFTRSMTAL